MHEDASREPAAFLRAVRLARALWQRHADGDAVGPERSGERIGVRNLDIVLGEGLKRRSLLRRRTGCN